MPAILSLVLVLLASSGCARCSPSPPDSGEQTTTTTAPRELLPPRTPPPKEWSHAAVRMPTGVAVPERCRHRAPLLAAEVPLTTHFAADPRTLGLVVAADTQLDPPSVLASGELRMTDQGVVHAGAWVPWPEASSAPRLALAPPSFAAGSAPWLGAWNVRWKKGDTEVVFARGEKAVSLGRGDSFAAADLACGPTKCALLTSRKGRAAPAGAAVLVVEADPTAPLAPVEIEPEGESNARPFGLAAVESPAGPVAVLSDSGQAVFWSLGSPPAPSVLARLPAEHGILDASYRDGQPLVIAHGNVVDEKGCAREGSDERGAKLRIVRDKRPALDISTPGAPALVGLRPLQTGYLLLWLSPLGCGAERQVVFGLVLDATGDPAGAPIPIADADTFAAASTGPDADVWIRNRERLTWLRLTCAP